MGKVMRSKLAMCVIYLKCFFTIYVSIFIITFNIISLLRRLITNTICILHQLTTYQLIVVVGSKLTQWVKSLIVE